MVEVKTVVRRLLGRIRECKPEPDADRLQTALSKSGIPDRVPFMELFADGEVMASILGKPLDYFGREIRNQQDWEERMLARMEFNEILGYDYLTVAGVDLGGFESVVRARERARETQRLSVAGEIGSKSSERWVAVDTAGELSRGNRGWLNEGTGVIANWNDFNSYNWQDPEKVVEEERTAGLDWICDHLPSGMGIVSGTCSILEPVMWMMGVRNFYLSLYKQPGLVDSMFKEIGKLRIAQFKVAAKTDREVIAYWGSDDWGYRRGLMVSPEMMRRWVFPVHRRCAEIAHSRGSLYILHSCGNLRAIMDDIIDEIRVDAKHSFEETGLSVIEAKRLYGHRIGLIGGVDMDVLSRKNPSDVRQYVSHALNNCMPEGGYCLGCGNSVANYVPLENYLTMLEVGLEQGWYD